MSAELDRERQALVKSGIDISEGEGRIARQLMLRTEMRAKGLDTYEAERLLDLLRQTLAQWQAHHVMIVDRIAYLEIKEGASGEGVATL